MQLPQQTFRLPTADAELVVDEFLEHPQRVDVNNGAYHHNGYDSPT